MRSRQFAILKLLDNEEGMVVTSAQLATEVNVSPKTVRMEIKQLNTILRDYNMYIKSLRGKGYILKGKNKEKITKLLSKCVNEFRTVVPVDSSARVNYLLEKLLFCTDYIKIEELLAELFISRSTLQGDLKTVRELLQFYGLFIEHKPNFGMKIVGDETFIRFCLSEYIFNQHPLLLKEQMGNILSLEELNIIRNSILENIRKHHIAISDISLHNLIIHLSIAYKRLLEHKSVEFVKEEIYSLFYEREYEVAQKIVEQIESGLGIKFPKTEVAYLAIHLKGTKLTSTANHLDFQSIVDKEIYCLAKEVIQVIDNEYDLKLTDDEELLRNLCLHLKPAISRFRYQMNIRNPMLEEIKMEYPLSFEAALTGVSVINERFSVQFNESEVGYVALHIEAALEKAKRSYMERKRSLIVCATGLGSSQLLLHKLINIFGKKLHITGTIELYNLTRLNLKDYDFIISTIPIKNKLPIPVIHISNILGNIDVSKIERMLDCLDIDLKEFIFPEFTFLQYDFQIPESVIKFLTNNLVQKGKADTDYIQSVLERESYAPTSFGNMVAIPHPLKPGTNATFLSILTLLRPINWGDKFVQLVILLNINKNRKEDLQLMFQSLVHLMNDKQKVFQLLRCKTYSELLEVIEE
ncbi:MULTISPECIES: BglG family transcription antiterminator [Virgibacillus]|uniref:BglG family transcription antiterminator n=1 Tax=Virgibacillus dokdonensis TaxID=302167 RepID=A0A2K9IUV5_9BACI|nr:MULTISPECIES: BglG family transcription antiterminator [Virgibacillus]AUJ23537.1 putative licABCH operon regulator [Virgibacillus dokdonensis]NWO14915.1 transcription antiterminator [Virgibacillus sp.]